MKKTTTKTITLQREIAEQVAEQAVAENRNFSNMIETLILRGRNTNAQTAF